MSALPQTALQHRVLVLSAISDDGILPPGFSFERCLQELPQQPIEDATATQANRAPSSPT